MLLSRRIPSSRLGGALLLAALFVYAYRRTERLFVAFNDSLGSVRAELDSVRTAVDVVVKKTMPGAVNGCDGPVVRVAAHTGWGHASVQRCDMQGWTQRVRPRRVIDAVILFDEIDLLEARLHELNEVVDHFVVVEANSTHQGQPKPSYYKDNELRLAPFANKIHHMIVGMPNCTWSWVCENYQRDVIMQAFLDLDGTDDDVLIVSDTDEIPKAPAVAFLRGCNWERPGSHARVVSLHADHYVFSSHCFRSDRPWTLGPKAATGRVLRRFGTHQLRTAYGKRKGPYAVTDTRPLMPFGRSLEPIAYQCSNFGPGIRYHIHDYPGRRACNDSTHVELFALRQAAWHFSFFKTPEQIVLKYAAISAGSKDYPYNSSQFHLEWAMRCRHFEHSNNWNIEYVANVTARHAPAFVLKNRCRMRRFFAYSRDPRASQPRSTKSIVFSEAPNDWNVRPVNS